MRVRITMEIMDDNYRAVETILPVDCLFEGVITDDTVAGVRQLAGEAIERHTRINKTFDGLAHWDGKKYALSARQPLHLGCVQDTSQARHCGEPSRSAV